MGPAPAIGYAQDPVITCVAVGHQVPGKAAEKARRTLFAAVRWYSKRPPPFPAAFSAGIQTHPFGLIYEENEDGTSLPKQILAMV